MPGAGGGAICDRAVPAVSGLPPGIGHNGGPPLESDDPGGGRLYLWKRAKKKAFSAPREIALRRLARAEELGMTYEAYTLEILERGRYL